MKKRNLLTVLLCMVLVFTIGVGATLAYFTDKTETKVNTFVAGTVDIEIIDESPEGDGLVTGEKTDEGIEYGTELPIMPGDVISKQVGVTVKEGSQDSWIGIKLTIEATPACEELTAEEAIASIQAIIDEQIADGWTKHENGIYYYDEAAVPGDYILFETLEIPFDDWGNEYAGITFSITVDAAAMQAANCELADFQALNFDEVPTALVEAEQPAA